MAPRGWLLVNPSSGAGSGTEELCREAKTKGIETRLLQPGDDVAALAREADADVIGAAGGDGSLALVATAAIERDLPFVCVPFGTRNHFARDLGLDRDDPIGALAAFEGAEHRVDVGRANDRVFLNNVSLGAYAVFVHHGLRRALDYLRLRHHYTVDGKQIRTRVLLVGNNAYSFTGARERLDEGLLHVYTAGGEVCTGTTVEVGLRHRRTRSAIDGESVALTAPITFTIEPGALRVLLPRPVA